MSEVNLGRVQGGGIFYSTASSGTSIVKSTLTPTGLVPLVGDCVVFPNGDLRKITAVSGTNVTCGSVAANFKGDKGDGLAEILNGTYVAKKAENDANGTPISLSGIMIGEVKLFAATVNPSETLGGTWEQLTADAYFKIVTTGAGATGGTSASHTIPLSSMPSHNHNFTETDNTGASGVYDDGRTIQRGYASTNALCSSLYQLDAQGGGQPYYPYYFGVYAWKRIA